jgi:hypothetical protein
MAKFQILVAVIIIFAEATHGYRMSGSTTAIGIRGTKWLTSRSERFTRGERTPLQV